MCHPAGKKKQRFILRGHDPVYSDSGKVGQLIITVHSKLANDQIAILSPLLRQQMDLSVLDPCVTYGSLDPQESVFQMASLLV